jgi:hypothetical protein
MLSKSIMMAAHAGLLVGALAGCAGSPPPESPADAASSGEATRKATETPAPATPVGEAAEGKSCCKGMNECKGKGGCRAGQHSCAGQNECKGQGGCNGHCPK